MIVQLRSVLIWWNDVIFIESEIGWVLVIAELAIHDGLFSSLVLPIDQIAILYILASV